MFIFSCATQHFVAVLFNHPGEIQVLSEVTKGGEMHKESEEHLLFSSFVFQSVAHAPPSLHSHRSIHHLSLVSTVYVWFHWFVCLFDSQEVYHYPIPVKTCQKPLFTLWVQTNFFTKKQMKRTEEEQAFFFSQ